MGTIQQTATLTGEYAKKLNVGDSLNMWGVCMYVKAKLESIDLGGNHWCEVKLEGNVNQCDNQNYFPFYQAGCGLYI